MALTASIAQMDTVSQICERRESETVKSKVAHRITVISTRALGVTIPKEKGLARALVSLSRTQPVCRKKS